MHARHSSSKAAVDENNVRFVPASGVKASRCEGGVALLNVETGDVFVGNAIAAAVWSEIAEGETLENTVSKIVRKYGIKEESARKDACEFVESLIEQGLLRRARVPRVWRNKHSLALAALWELIRYDIVMALFRFRRIYREFSASPPQACAAAPDIETAVVDAVNTAGSFYWKPVMCLQRSVAAARLLRRYGVGAQLVIGYRNEPFFSHAWVEVAGRVVNDSQGYARRLAALARV
jgi:hypothetical protein